MSHANQINEKQSDDFHKNSVSEANSANEIASGKKIISEIHHSVMTSNNIKSYHSIPFH